MPHLNEHRQQLAHQMEEVVQDHDMLKQDLTRDSPNHPLIVHVNQWEQRSIEMIRAVAQQARADIDQWVQQAKININKSVDSLARELQLQREEDAYTEKDLERLKQQLQELRNQLDKPSTITVENDGAKEPLQMIKVRQKRKFTSDADDAINRSTATLHSYFADKQQKKMFLFTTQTKRSSAICLF